MANLIKTALNRSLAEKLPKIEEIEAFGIEGEESIFRTLYQGFDCVIRNPVVPHKNLYLEKDFAVLHRGVWFVLEVKHWKGKICLENGEFYQKKQNGTQKKQKSPVGTTRQFIDKMRSFYQIEAPVFGIVVFGDTDCSIDLPPEMDGILLLRAKDLVAKLNSLSRAHRSTLSVDPSRVLRCTRFYSKESEFCKGVLADCYFDCEAPDGSIVRIDTGCLRYLSVEPQPLLLRDKLYLTYTNGATDIFYNRDTILTVACLDGSFCKLSISRMKHIVF